MAPAVGGLDMDYTVDMSARVGGLASDAGLGVRLLSALEASAPDAAVSQDTRAGTVAAAFTVDAPDAASALEEAQRLLVEALETIGVEGELVEVHLVEATATAG
ncbi:MAG: hypothetical protein ABR540_14665 [Acidimicrobiales bacterium]